jgi:site-specific DNA-cytosine methylase
MAQLLEDISSGRKVLPQVHYMHFSPPCQDISQAKKQEQKRFTGETLM